MKPAVSHLTECDLQGGLQGIRRALVLHRTTCLVLLANLYGSFAVCVSKTLQILASSPSSLLVCWFLGKYWSGKLFSQIPFIKTVSVCDRFLGWFPLPGMPWILPANPLCSSSQAHSFVTSLSITCILSPFSY